MTIQLFQYELLLKNKNICLGNSILLESNQAGRGVQLDEQRTCSECPWGLGSQDTITLAGHSLLRNHFTLSSEPQHVEWPFKTELDAFTTEVTGLQSSICGMPPGTGETRPRWIGL